MLLWKILSMLIMKRERVEVRIPVKGGLGNQMFGYAYCLYLNGRGYIANLSWRDMLFTKIHNGIELNKAFYIQLNCSDLILIKVFSIVNFLSEKSFLIKRIIAKAISWVDSLYGVYIQPTPYNYEDIHFMKNTISNGFWQNIKYIEPNEINLRKDFTFRLPDNYEALSVVKLIKDCNSIGLHIRRGDYLKKEFSIYNVLSGTSYYNDALSHLMSSLNTYDVFVFSDDLEWCKQKFAGNYFHFVNINNGSFSYLDMYLMTLCKYLIISNSTFSWWAGWLNPHQNVIAPCFWTTDGVMTSNFSPSNWKYI